MSDNARPVADAAQEPVSAAPTAWVLFWSSRAGFAGAGFLILLSLLSLFAAWIAPYDPLAQVTGPLQGPTGEHLFGTDEVGRDILSRVLVGSQLSLMVALGSSLLALAIGAPLGILAGYLGGFVDSVLMRVTDFFLSVPGILSALVIVVVLGPGGANLMLAIGLSSFPAFARLSRVGAIALRDRAYVRAARTMGASSFDIMFRTIAPNVMSPLIVQLSVTASAAVLATAALSFLGLGAPPPAPSWGGMLQVSRTYFYDAPLYGLFPGILLALTIAAFDGVSRGLQEALGEKSGSRGRSGLVV